MVNPRDFAGEFRTPPQEDRPVDLTVRAREIYPRELIYENASEVTQNHPQMGQFGPDQPVNLQLFEYNENPPEPIRLNFAAVRDPYENMKPKLSGLDRAMAATFGENGDSARKKRDLWVRAKHPEHAQFLDATDSWTQNCFVKG